MPRTAKSQCDSQPRAADGGPSAVRRRWKRILIACCAAVALLLVLTKFLDRQPRYQGRTVESWLAQLWDQNRSQPDTLRALKAMGRDAVPYEIRVLGRHDSIWRRNLRGIRENAPAFVAGMLPDLLHPHLMRGAATTALLDNPYTPKFAPDIVQLLDDSDPVVRLHAMVVVSNLERGLDRWAVPALCRALKDPAPRMRAYAAATLGEMGPKAQEAVSDLELLLQDADSQVRPLAADALLRVHCTNLAYGPVNQPVSQIQTLPARSETSHVTNR